MASAKKSKRQQCKDGCPNVDYEARLWLMRKSGTVYRLSINEPRR